MHFRLPGYLEFPYEYRHLDPIINTDLGFQIGSTDTTDVNDIFNRLSAPFDFDVTYYTDGSREESGNATGYAVFSPELGYEYKERINNYNTIFEAEALAIQHAIDSILNNKIKKSAIFSDSLSVLSSLANPATTNKSHQRVFQIRGSLFECTKQSLEIHIIWIPSHRGIYGNERADILAKESLHLPDPLLLSKCHYTNLYSRFKSLSKDRAIRVIQAESFIKGTKYFAHKPDILSPPWYTNRKIKEILPRSVITLVSRLRSNHTATMGHLWRKNITDSSECQCGHSFQDLNHTFFGCRDTSDSSNLLISGLKKIDPNITLDVQTLAFTSDTRVHHLLHNFVRRNNISI
ncbi:uncharacterized protein [Polyergus mexicanus]|uniref:uncharacterized protein n=1 Tax=Polyergus mexicanus TaxID=615972 RepID=UPI0038B4C418